MKKLFFVVFLLLCAVADALSVGQVVGINRRQQVVLVFPSEIRYADFGRGDVVGRVCQGSCAIALKTTASDLPETTVSVVSADGTYYEFAVVYREALDFIAYDVVKGIIPADTLALSTDKTSHFIASSKVIDYVVGSDSLAAAYAESIENIVKAKQIYEVQAPSSLCVLTSTAVYPYVVLPDAEVRTSVKMGTETGEAIFREASVNDGKLKEKAQYVLQQEPFVTGVGTLAHRMEFALLSVMTDGDWVMLRLQVTNRSDLDYAVDFVKVYIQDRRSAKNMATQEDEIFPSYVYYSNSCDSQWIYGRGSMEFVQFFPRFSLPEKRMLTIEMFEKNGGRHLTFHVLPQELLKARKM